MYFDDMPDGQPAQMPSDDKAGEAGESEESAE